MNRKILKWLLLLLFCFCLIPQVEAAGEIEWCVYVDPDAGGANDGGRDGADPNDPSQANNWTDAYPSLSAMHADSASCGGLDTADLTAAVTTGVWLHVYCRSSSGGDDTTTFRFDAFTNDADSYILVEGYDYPTDGKRDETKYLLHNNDSATQAVECRQNYIIWEKIQFKVTQTGANTRYGLVFNVIDVSNAIRIDNCSFKGVCSGTGTANGINLAGDNININIWNTIVTGFFISANTDFRGINIGGSSATLYNVTVYNCTRGINNAAETTNLINCAIFNCDDDVVGSFNSITYSALDDAQAGTGNIQISQSADDWAALVVDAAGDDFNVTDTDSELHDNGDGTTPKTSFTVDCAGTTRGPADGDWDIGAYELEVGNGNVVPIIVNIQNQ